MINKNKHNKKPPEDHLPEVDPSTKSPTSTQSLIQAFITNLLKWC